jgi:hypothetical protein
MIIPSLYRYFALAILAAALVGFGWMQGAHHVQLQFAKFEAATEALGKAQTQQTKVINDRNLTLKQESDLAYLKAQNNLTSLYADYRRLRNNGSSSRTVSSLPTRTSDPTRICFDRAKFTDAVGIIEAGIPAITEQGDSAIVGLNSAKKWAQTK